MSKNLMLKNVYIIKNISLNSGQFYFILYDCNKAHRFMFFLNVSVFLVDNLIYSTY